MSPRVVVASRRLGLISKMVCFGQYAILLMALAAASDEGNSWIIGVIEDCRLSGNLEGFEQFQALDDVAKIFKFLRAQGVRKLRNTLKRVFKQKKLFSVKDFRVLRTLFLIISRW